MGRRRSGAQIDAQRHDLGRTHIIFKVSEGRETPSLREHDGLERSAASTINRPSRAALKLKTTAV